MPENLYFLTKKAHNLMVILDKPITGCRCLTLTTGQKPKSCLKYLNHYTDMFSSMFS